MTRHFFTFGGGTPYRQLYVEVAVASGGDRPPGYCAREAMSAAHGNKWAFQYDDPAKFAEQIEEYGLKRLALIERNAKGDWIAVDVLGEE